MYPTATETAPLVTRSQRSSLAELFEVILDRGMVIDAYVRVSLVGIELLTVDARVVIASVDTYLHFAEAVNRLDLRETSDAWGITDLSGAGSEMADEATDEALDSVTDKLKGAIPFLGNEAETSSDAEDGG